MENRSHLDLKFFEIAKNAGTSIPESAKVVLNMSAFTLFLKGPSVSGIEEALKRIGLKFDWDALGRTASLQKVFGTKSAVRDTTKEITKFLADAERIRNHIVHRGDKIQPVTEGDLTQHAAIFELVAIGIADYLKAKVDAL